ncbi:MAG: enoyl-CoA hydratase/isomerase family protein [Rhodobacteraceae bacterium]|nr:enoyl-CoA hydratase/isomerase family protein [Paracoccaceae bacterium]
MIVLDRDGPLWTLRIDRAEKANALTRGMLEDLVAAVKSARDTAQALVITGEGKVFSAGADLEEVHSGLEKTPLWEELSGAIAGLPCLTVAALNGTLAGGAFGMALACDLRIAVPTAKFFYPVMKLGFLPQPSDPGRLAALVGPARAKLILMAGQKIEADEALSIGLIDRIVPAAELQDTAKALAADALAATPEHASAIKAMVNPGN